eukprot:1613726-Pleurochrysis_carterae.AAC.3
MARACLTFHLVSHPSKDDKSSYFESHGPHISDTHGVSLCMTFGAHRPAGVVGKVNAEKR